MSRLQELKAALQTAEYTTGSDVTRRPVYEQVSAAFAAKEIASESEKTLP